LFWALGFLRRSMPASLRPDDESLTQASFSAARRLVANQCDQVLRITHSALLADRRAMANRIVAELSKGGTPVRFREITRFFKDQRKERIAPVTDALVEVGVLVLDHDGFYTLGPVELADAEEILNQKFAQP